MKDTSPTLGNLCTGPEPRDAIHIAICPVMSDEQVFPGQHLGLAEKSMTKVCQSEKPIGIVDPFLRAQVPPKTWFWLVLYPKTVTSLRHEWTHPAFGGVAQVAYPTPTEISEAWLRDFSRRFAVPYEEMMADVENGDSIYIGDDNQQGRANSELDEFQRHCETVLGHDLETPIYFSCAC